MNRTELNLEKLESRVLLSSVPLSSAAEAGAVHPDLTSGASMDQGLGSEPVGNGTTVQFTFEPDQVEVIVGESFQLEGHFTDIDADPDQPVQSGYADITFDPTILRVDSISYNEDYPNLRLPDPGSDVGGSIDNETGLIDEVGGDSGGSLASTDWVFTLHMTATAIGEDSILSEETSANGDDEISDITIFGVDGDQSPYTTWDTCDVVVTPEPSTTVLAAAAGVAAGIYIMRNKRRQDRS
mgnify:CR=1 FL=1